MLVSVIYAYDQALLCLGYLPDIWYEAAHFQQQAAKLLTEKGEVKQASAVYDEVVGKQIVNVALLHLRICSYVRESDHGSHEGQSDIVFLLCRL